MSGLEILGVVIAVAVVVALAWLWFRSLMGKAARLWEANRALVQGTLSRWRIKLTGTWERRPVVAYLATDKVDTQEISGGNSVTYAYILRMTFPAGFENWSATYRSRKGQPAGWELKAGSRTDERLRAAGLMAALEQAPRNCRLRYRASKGIMQLSIAGVGMWYCPDAQVFQSQLELLSRIGTIAQSAGGTGLARAA